MILNDEQWREHIAMLKASGKSESAELICSEDCDRLEEIRMAISNDLPPENPFEPGTVESAIYEMRKRKTPTRPAVRNTDIYLMTVPELQQEEKIAKNRLKEIKRLIRKRNKSPQNTESSRSSAGMNG